MASMYDIYRHHRDRYDLLVSAEDWRGNLSAFLRSAVDWQGRTVLECGTGTGRVTEIYLADIERAICLDREEHMLEAAKHRLSGSSVKIIWGIGDNLDLPRLPTRADVFIEGWSWGHSIVDRPGRVEDIAELLFENVRKNLAPEADVILIETMGTNQTAPGAPLPRLAEFYRLLRDKYGFEETVLSTDYQFETVEDAADILGFFFGDEMKRGVLGADRPIVPEWTGVWIGRLHSEG